MIQQREGGSPPSRKGHRRSRCFGLALAAILTTDAALADPTPHLRLCVSEAPAAPCTFQESQAVLHSLSTSKYYLVEFDGYVSSGRYCGMTLCADLINPNGDLAEIKPVTHAEHHPLVGGCQLPHTVPCPDPPDSQDPAESGNCPKTISCCSNTCDNYDVGCTNPYCANLYVVVKVHAWSTDGSDWQYYEYPIPVFPDSSCRFHDSSCRN